MKLYITIIALLILITVAYRNYEANQTSKKIIYIYNDAGVSAESVSHTKMFLHNVLKNNYVIQYINAAELLQATWTKNAALFVLPGGADKFYVAKMRGKGDKIIQNYINKGGSFLGICAGAYYASSFIEFDKNGPNEVIGERYLNLVNSYAIGPILAEYSYDSNKGAKAALIKCNNKQVNIFYNGGPYFYIPKNNKTTEIICTYSKKNDLPAIVYSKYGKGKVLLSAVHFEYDSTKLNHSDQYYRDIIATLSADNINRIALGSRMLEMLGISTTI